MKAVSQEGTPRRSRLTDESCVCACLRIALCHCDDLNMRERANEREMRVLLQGADIAHPNAAAPQHAGRVYCGPTDGRRECLARYGR
jgi:hypothetical protein